MQQLICGLEAIHDIKPFRSLFGSSEADRRKLQEFELAKTGLVTNIVSFNVGVEIGQGVALTGILLALNYWRTQPGFLRHALVTNTLLMTGGFLLVGYQLSGYFLGA